MMRYIYQRQHTTRASKRKQRPITRERKEEKIERERERRTHREGVGIQKETKPRIQRTKTALACEQHTTQNTQRKKVLPQKPYIISLLYYIILYICTYIYIVLCILRLLFFFLLFLSKREILSSYNGRSGLGNLVQRILPGLSFTNRNFTFFLLNASNQSLFSPFDRCPLLLGFQKVFNSLYSVQFSAL